MGRCCDTILLRHNFWPQFGPQFSCLVVFLCLINSLFGDFRSKQQSQIRIIFSSPTHPHCYIFCLAYNYVTVIIKLFRYKVWMCAWGKPAGTVVRNLPHHTSSLSTHFSGYYKLGELIRTAGQLCHAQF